VLYNIWDAGGAATLAKAGAPAVATGSWAMAAAHGFDDGEMIPLDLVLTIVRRICASVDLPVTVDFEGGYAAAPEDVAKNVRDVIRAGAVGINFEDRVVRGDGLYSVTDQAARITGIRSMATEEGVPLVLNARTDLFLGTEPGTHASRVAEAVDRAEAYAAAGATCFFIPGLTEAEHIARIVGSASLPVNVMMISPLETVAQVAAYGVARVSYGPAPFFSAQSDLRQRFERIEERS